MKKVLIIKLGAFGDVVLATPHIQLIMQKHEKSHVTLMTSQSMLPLFSAFEFDEIYTLPRKGLWAWLKAMAFVKRQRFDVIYDLQSNDRSALLVALSSAGEKVGMGARKIYTVHEQAKNRPTHIFDRYEKLFGSLGFEPAQPYPVIGVSDVSKAKVNDWLAQHEFKNSFVICHVGSSPRWLSKRWPLQNFEQLALLLEKAGVQVVWIGAKDEKELNIQLASKTGVNATALFNFEELVALAEHACCAIVNDSGPMHILAAAKIPVYAFFGPTNAQRSHAIGQKERVLSVGVECSPCFLPECPPEKKHACMTEILPEDVLNRLKEDQLLD